MESRVIYMGGNTLDNLAQEQRRVKAIASGDMSGNYPPTPNKQDLDSLNQNYETACQKVTNAETRTTTNVAEATYTGASWRDANYCIAGRKYIRINMLNGKNYAAYQRACILQGIELSREGEG